MVITHELREVAARDDTVLNCLDNMLAWGRRRRRWWEVLEVENKTIGKVERRMKLICPPLKEVWSCPENIPPCLA